MGTEIIVAIIGAVATIAAAYIGAFIAAKRQVDKGVKKLSGNLPSWELLYEHDENGNKINGTIEHLIEAVGKAYPIKIKIYREKGKFEMTDAQWIFVEDSVVYATNVDQISLPKDAVGNYSYVEDAYHYYVIVGSEGYHHATRIFVDGRKSNTTNSKRRMTWYGLVPPQ
jgi:hypothetical protein